LLLLEFMRNSGTAVSQSLCSSLNALVCAHKLFDVVSSTVIVVMPRQNYKTCYTAVVLLGRKTITKFELMMYYYLGAR